jgi:hypothetical protein
VGNPGVNRSNFASPTNFAAVNGFHRAYNMTAGGDDTSQWGNTNDGPMVAASVTKAPTGATLRLTTKPKKSQSRTRSKSSKSKSS